MLRTARPIVTDLRSWTRRHNAAQLREDRADVEAQLRSRRYGARVDTWRLPTSKIRWAELVAACGRDAVVLLRAVHDAAAAAWLRELPAVEMLRRVLVQNYGITTDATGRDRLRHRAGPLRRRDKPPLVEPRQAQDRSPTHPAMPPRRHRIHQLGHSAAYAQPLASRPSLDI